MEVNMDKTVSPNDKPFRLITEVDFAIECVVHGPYARGNVRALPLGHGRAYIDLGNSICTRCGTSINLTIRTVDTKWEDVPAQKIRDLMKEALEQEFGTSIDAEPEPEPEEEEVHQPEPASTPAAPVAPLATGLAPFGKRPGFQ
jgi:hypothetical protein